MHKSKEFGIKGQKVFLKNTLPQYHPFNSYQYESKL